jgi:hypothetical protein
MGHDNYNTVAEQSADSGNASKPGRHAVERDQLFGRGARPDQRPFVFVNKYFGNERAAVIGAGLGRAISASRHHGEKLTRLRLDERAVEREEVA